MKIYDLILARNVILKKANEPIATKLAYKFMKFLKASGDEDAFYSKKAEEIKAKYTKDGETQMTEEFVKEVAELNATEVDKPEISFDLEELECLSFSVSEIYSLSEFIKEE